MTAVRGGRPRSVRRVCRIVGIVACGLVESGSPAVAQVGATGVASDRLSLAMGGAWVSGQVVGVSSATLTSNQVPLGGPFPLFDVRTELVGSGLAEAALGARLTRSLVLEGRFGYARPRVRTTVSNDVEVASPTSFDDDRLSQYLVEGSLVWFLRGNGVAAQRVAPFVRAGAGYLRELHDGGAVVESGTLVHVGGGLQHQLVRWADRALRGLALRGEARASLRHGAFALQDQNRFYGTVGGALVLLF